MESLNNNNNLNDNNHKIIQIKVNDSSNNTTKEFINESN